MTDEFLSRRTVRHALLRARNTRIAEFRDDRMPRELHMHPDTLSELLVDGDPFERHLVDFEGKTLMGVVIVRDQSLPVGEVRIVWPPVPGAAADPALLEEAPRE